MIQSLLKQPQNIVLTKSTYGSLGRLPDLVVNSAYFDDRPRSNHSNVTVFFAVIRNNLLLSNAIVACGVGTERTDHLYTRYIYERMNQIRTNRKRLYKFEQITVECYDLSVVNGSYAYVIYKPSNSTKEKEVVVVSERPLMIPAPRIQPTGDYDFTVAVSTKVHNKGVPFLPEFITYQKTIGVDHVCVTVLYSFVENGDWNSTLKKYPSVQTAIDSGFVDINVWKEYHSVGAVYDHSTNLHHLDCFYRNRGTYDYIFPMDTDDFFVPRIPGKTQLKYYINEYCRSKSAASCRFKWLLLYPDVCGTGTIGKDGNVTDAVKSHRLFGTSLTKSIHSTKSVIDFTYHSANCTHCLMPSEHQVFMPQQKTYVAHNRKYKKFNVKEVC